MQKFTPRRAIALALTIATVAAVTVVSTAGAQNNRPPTRATVQTVGGVEFKKNRYIQDTMRFNRDVYEIRSGGTLTIRDRTRQPHSLSVVRRNQLPRTARGVENCFGRGPCDEIAQSHGVTDDESPPTIPVVNVGREGLDRPGDSIFLPGSPAQRIEVSARRGTDLYFLCAIHPWMQGTIEVG